MLVKKIGRKSSRAMAGAAIGAAVIGLASLASFSAAPAALAQASSVWYVWTNCNNYPCTIGVGIHGYAQPGTANYAAGWRQLSQSFRTSDEAWKRACWYHYSHKKYSSPDIISGAVNCAALCKGNARCN